MQSIHLDGFAFIVYSLEIVSFRYFKRIDTCAWTPNKVPIQWLLCHLWCTLYFPALGVSLAKLDHLFWATYPSHLSWFTCPGSPILGHQSWNNCPGSCHGKS